MRSVVLIAVMLASWAAGASAQTVGVMPVKGTNLGEGEASAIGALVASSYQSQTTDRVIGPDETGAAVAQAGSDKAAIEQLQLSEYITVSAVRLGARIAVEATLHNKHGSRLFQARTTAQSIDDMQVVAERIAASLYRRTPLEHTQELDNVTQKEAQQPTRTFAEHVPGLRTALILPFATDFDPSPSLLAEFNLRLEGESYFVEFAVGFILPSNGEDRDDRASFGGLHGHLGASYYLSNTSVSPYIGGGVSPRIVGGSYSGPGLTVGGQAGLMFMRQSQTRFYIEARLDQNVLPLGVDTGDGTYDPERMMYVYPKSREVYPTELSLAVGIGW